MVTLKDLALKLGVSVSTVSKALNSSPEISEETVRRVKEIAAELNYKPNRLALSLKNRKTKTLGVIIPNILNHFFARVLYGIEQKSAELGYNIITCISNESYEKEKESLELLANGSVDGFIMSIAEESQMDNITSHFTHTIEQNLPIVMFDRVANSVKCDKVVIDDFGAALNATKLLIKEGRKKIILINRLEELSVGKLRAQGYTTAIEEVSGYKNDPIIVSMSNHEVNIEQHIKKMFDDHQDVDGIVCIDNISGVIALNLAKSNGKSIPQDISIIGFSSDNVLHFTSPKLSTVTQHGEEIGKESVKLLVDQLENNDKYKRVLKTVNFSINLRGTTLPEDS